MVGLFLMSQLIASRNPDQVKLSIVLPLYNEVDSIGVTLSRIINCCQKKAIPIFEIIAVDDGSLDSTLASLHHFRASINELKIVALNRNFGKEAAIHAGLQCAKGEVVLVMDGDGQHPVELVSDMLALWGTGADVVAGCKLDRGDEGVLYRAFSKVFYWLFNLLTRLDIRNLSDFMLLDRVVVDQYCRLPERKRFFRGMIVWMGYATEKVYFNVRPRAAGESSWGKVQLIKYASNAISTFTSSPLHLISVISGIYFIFAFFIGAIALFDKLSGHAVTGFTTVILLVLCTGALVMLGLGQVGIYLERVFEELKRRPNYLINRSKSTIFPEE